MVVLQELRPLKQREAELLKEPEHEENLSAANNHSAEIFNVKK